MKSTLLSLEDFHFPSFSAHCSRKELRNKEISQDQVQSNSIDPSQVIQLSWQPRVFLYRNFLSDEECDYLISWVHRKKSHNMQVDDLPKSDHVDTDDEIARNIEERISAWTFLPKENSKSLQVLHFGPEDSKQKYNYFQNKAAEEVGEPLLATLFCISQICPVLEGDMWCATKFFYLKNVHAEKVRSDSDNADCTEDDNCPRWAATGEWGIPFSWLVLQITTGHVGRAAMHALCDSYSHVYSSPPIMSFFSFTMEGERIC
ncbi:UNVERIFIED_CONTAM: putative prolyl 4-hydroxylase 12 [Sesamum calycinum]|uniref:Prolyl 4-hydroxylase 12 n=1 Tax=Sesamum calycinum TaxID=2727403 RepID=A0AAW2RS98_9LAMI